jgi:hypothetical protein
MKISEILNDLFTGPDGKTFAVGRVMGITGFISGQALPFTALFKHQTLDFSALGVFEASLFAGITALVLGTNPTEPKAP